MAVFHLGRAARLGLVLGLALACIVTAAPVSAQVAGDIDEIVRRSEAGAQEDGFCAVTGWPNGDNWEGFKAFLQTANVGTWKINTFKNGNCELDRVTRVHNEGSTRCVAYTLWTCTKGKACGKGASVDCLKADGTLDRRKG